MTPWVKRLAGACVFTAFLAVLVVLQLIPMPYRLRVIPTVASFFSKMLLRVLDIQVDIIGVPPTTPCLIAANHMSYLDIPVLASCYRSLYVTSQEMRAGIGIGQMIGLTHCHTVDREKRTTLLYDIKEMSILLAEGHSITLFPEATTSSGNILPFKPALLTTAGHAGVPIQPVAIRYLGLDNKSRDAVFYYGEKMEIGPHIFSLACLPKLRVEVEFLEPLYTEGCRKKFAHDLQKTVAVATLSYPQNP